MHFSAFRGFGEGNDGFFQVVTKNDFPVGTTMVKFRFYQIKTNRKTFSIKKE